ncbi:MAG: sulfur oxidation c-type cytochrome SoxA [Sulfuricellaceae bacterium]
MKINLKTLPVLLCLAFAVQAHADDKPYREHVQYDKYVPKVSGDATLTNTYRYWKDRSKLPESMVGDAAEDWKLNWKYRDEPYNSSLHGGHVAWDRGEEVFKELNKDGGFAACLGAPKGNLKGVRVAYPRYDKEAGHVVALEEQIERCAAKQNATLENGSYDNSAVSVYVGSFSNGMPIKIDVSKGPLKEAYERGKYAFNLKAGRLNMACATCHVVLPGKNLRGQTPTTPYGDASHWPTWRGKDELQSLHVRLAECNRNASVQPLKPGSMTYTDIEVFLNALSNGYPIALPSIRD